MVLTLIPFVLETRAAVATGTHAANRPLAEGNLLKGILSKVFREDKTKGWDLAITPNIHLESGLAAEIDRFALSEPCFRLSFGLCASRSALA
jgi:hypothetical protein